MTNLYFLYVWVQRYAEQDTVLRDKDHVEEELPDQRAHVLQRFSPRQQQGVHPDHYKLQEEKNKNYFK